MRWFSFNDCAKEYHGTTAEGDYKGQLWALRMVLEHHFHTAVDEELDAAPKPVLPTHDDAPKEELRKLKAQMGALKLTPKLITDDNLWVLDLIMAVSDAGWHAYGDTAKNTKSVDHAIPEAIAMKQGRWQAEVVELVAGCLNGASNRKCFHKLGLLDCTDDAAVEKTDNLVDLVLLIIHHRARSGATLTSLIPHRCMHNKP